MIFLFFFAPYLRRIKKFYALLKIMIFFGGTILNPNEPKWGGGPNIVIKPAELIYHGPYKEYPPPASQSLYANTHNTLTKVHLTLNISRFETSNYPSSSSLLRMLNNIDPNVRLFASQGNSRESSASEYYTGPILTNSECSCVWGRGVPQKYVVICGPSLACRQAGFNCMDNISPKNRTAIRSF